MVRSSFIIIIFLKNVYFKDFFIFGKILFAFHL